MRPLSDHNQVRQKQGGCATQNTKRSPHLLSGESNFFTNVSVHLSLIWPPTEVTIEISIHRTASTFWRPPIHRKTLLPSAVPQTTPPAPKSFTSFLLTPSYWDAPWFPMVYVPTTATHEKPTTGVPGGLWRTEKSNANSLLVPCLTWNNKGCHQKWAPRIFRCDHFLSCVF